MSPRPPTPPDFPESADPLRRWRRLAPARVALVDRTRDLRVTYGELDVGADRWRAALGALGVGPGDRVAVLAGSRTARD